MHNDCYCGSAMAFLTCCAPFLQGEALPETAEQLMRSRYSAYVSMAIDYLADTVSIYKKAEHRPEAIRGWAESVDWKRLELLGTSDVSENEGTVEFRAWYIDAGGLQCLQENSVFYREQGKWKYSHGSQSTAKPKVGRNEPCPCGSGKKYKKCCG